jgi:hypothetical protein
MFRIEQERTEFFRMFRIGQQEWDITYSSVKIKCSTLNNTFKETVPPDFVVPLMACTKRFRLQKEPLLFLCISSVFLSIFIFVTILSSFTAYSKWSDSVGSDGTFLLILFSRI